MMEFFSFYRATNHRVLHCMSSVAATVEHGRSQLVCADLQRNWYHQGPPHCRRTTMGQVSPCSLHGPSATRPCLTAKGNVVHGLCMKGQEDLFSAMCF